MIDSADTKINKTQSFALRACRSGIISCRKCFLLFSQEIFFFFFLAVLGLRFVRGLSPVAASGGHSSLRCGDRSSSRCAGLSLSRPLPLRGTGSRRAGSVIVAHGPSHSAARGIFPDQGSNPCPLHWQADSQPLRHQGSPGAPFLIASPGGSLSLSGM